MSGPLSDNDSLLDLCLSEIRDQGRTVEDCLARYPESRAIEPLLRLTEQLRSAQKLTAPADFRLSAAERLQKRMQDQLPAILARQPLSVPEQGKTRSHWATQEPAKTRRPFTGRTMPSVTQRPRRTAWVYGIGITVLILMLLVTTTTSYASQSLPGEPLYSVKIATEQAQLALAFSDAQQASLHVEFAGNRLHEMVVLAETGKLEPLHRTVDAYQSEINAARTCLSSKPLTPQERAAIFRQFTEQLVNNNSQISEMLAKLSGAHSAVPTETALKIQNETKPVVGLIHTMFAGLRNELATDQDLQKEFQEFSGFETIMAVDETESTATPEPHFTFTFSLKTPVPGVTHTEGWETELPTSVVSSQPTPWPTDWATLFPTPSFSYTPIILPTGLPTAYPTDLPTNWPTYLPTYLPTYWPTRLPTSWPTYIPSFLPTYLPTYFPTAPNNGSGDDDPFPGWEWPTEMPPDNGDGDEPPPGWWPGGGNDNGGSGGGGSSGGGDEPPGWSWPGNGGGNSGGSGGGDAPGDDAPPGWGWP